MHTSAAPGAHRKASPVFPLHIHIASLFGVLLAITVAVVSLFHHGQSQRIAVAAHEQHFARLSALAADSLEQTRGQLTRVVDLLSRSELAQSQTLKERLSHLELLQEILRLDPNLTRLSVGYTNGDLLSIRTLTADHAPRTFPQSRIVVDSVERMRNQPDRSQRIYYDDQLRPQGSTLGTDTEPRLTHWYQEAINHPGQIAFMPAPRPGASPTAIFARRSTTGRSAVAAEVQLARLGEAISHPNSVPSAWVALLANGTPIFRSATGDEAPPTLLDTPKGEGVSQTTTTTPDGAGWRLSRQTLTALGDSHLELVLAAPESELFTEADRIMNQSLWISLALFLGTLPITWLASRLVARPLRLLASQARSVQEFRFPTQSFTRSIVSEVDDLGHSLGAMQRTIKRFLDTGRTLTAQRDFASLIRQILGEALEVAALDHGALYLLTQDETQLEPVIAQRAGAWIDAPPEAGFQALPRGGDSHLLAALRWGIHPQPIVGGLAQAVMAHLPLTPVIPGAEMGQLMAIPLNEHNGTLIGALWLHLPRGTPPPRPDQGAFLAALADVAAIALQNQRLLQGRKALLEAVVAMMAGAIDAKSPHTGSHCQRVPALLSMLAQAACQANHAPFTHFQLDTAGWESLRIAGWLHDCGKVTTPEYVIDKATKLETLYNRLHEVRMRFEVLKRDAQIAHWRQVAALGEVTSEMTLRLNETLQALDQEFALVARCNQGSAPLTEADCHRLQHISQRTWLRTLDDTLGLSWEELSRKPSPSRPLPALEPVLADKPEHLIAHRNNQCYTPGNPWGFRINRPPYHQNLGELHNLTVAQGTLTPEERHLINDHIVQSIVMLSRLPFPRELATVLEIAGSHHEHLDGTGYPRRLTGPQLSLPARMLAMADVFEALTAADRPYKSGKTVAEAVAILHLMAASGHLDADLLALALKAGVFERYAQQFLGPQGTSSQTPEAATGPKPPEHAWSSL